MPTVCVESIFIRTAIEVYESRDVATLDLPIAYLNEENDKVLHMRLQGQLAELTFYMTNTSAQTVRENQF